MSRDSLITDCQLSIAKNVKNETRNETKYSKLWKSICEYFIDNNRTSNERLTFSLSLSLFLNGDVFSVFSESLERRALSSKGSKLIIKPGHIFADPRRGAR